MKLCESNDSGFYAALSYCWGDPVQPQATTTVNVEQRLKEGFSLSDMPLTIANAIKVARKLDIRYIWIDSLCIIQDSREDKKAEIKKMKDIFEGAFFTIVAASATSVTDGFLQDREFEVSAFIEDIPFWTSDGKIGRVMLCCWEEENQELDPVHTRGWTFEEWLLSPRRLCYTRGQLTWFCKGFTKVNGGMPNSVGMPDRSYGDWRSTSINALKQGSKMTPDQQISHLWYQLVAKYTRRQLTDSADRLLAIDGIAKRLSFRSMKTYRSGLWVQNLVDDLCWLSVLDRKLPNAQSAVRSELKCPTWSWGSVCAPIEFDVFDDGKDLATVNLNWKNDVQLRVEGSLLTIQSWTQEDFGAGSGSKEPIVAFEFAGVESTFRAEVFEDIDLSPAGVASTLRLLPLKDITPDQESSDILDARGLVVQSSSDSDGFTRVGYFRGLRMDSTFLAAMDKEAFVLN